MSSIFDPKNGKYCNTHDDLSHKQVYGSLCVGGESVDLNAGVVKSLTPDGNTTKAPLKAQIIIEKDPAQAPGEIVARFTMCGNNPDDNTGFPIGHMGTFCVGNAANISNFKIVSLGGFTPKLRVMYFD